MKKTKGIATAVMIFALISVLVITRGDPDKELATGFAFTVLLPTPWVGLTAIRIQTPLKPLLLITSREAVSSRRIYSLRLMSNWSPAMSGRII
ncbi:hypothetical protein A3848_22305 [Paenibacillus sp. P32E]|nr:hypothetical protein A3848_22305 [Paenibacillus sp. P32E]